MGMFVSIFSISQQPQELKSCGFHHLKREGERTTFFLNILMIEIIVIWIEDRRIYSVTHNSNSYLQCSHARKRESSAFLTKHLSKE